MDTPNDAQDNEKKSLESIVEDLAMQLSMQKEVIRPSLLQAYRELWSRAVIKDFVSIFAMRRVLDKFSGAKGKRQRK